MKKQTAVDWLVENIKQRGLYTKEMLEEFKLAKEMEKEQQKRMYSEEEMIAIVEKSRKTGLTVKYLLLTEQFKK